MIVSVRVHVCVCNVLLMLHLADYSVHFCVRMTETIELLFNDVTMCKQAKRPASSKPPIPVLILEKTDLIIHTQKQFESAVPGSSTGTHTHTEVWTCPGSQDGVFHQWLPPMSCAVAVSYTWSSATESSHPAEALCPPPSHRSLATWPDLKPSFPH